MPHPATSQHAAAPMATPVTLGAADWPQPPVIWSVAGLDTAGGAGLSADQRAADALGVHLCPVAAALTAQHSKGVASVHPVDTATLLAQLRALASDLPPRAIKTGLLGSVDAVLAVAREVDRLRAATPPGQDPHRHLALIVDPVLGASAGGAAFDSEALLAAYRAHLLPRATVLTPNRAEARRLLGEPARHDGPATTVPALARGLLAMGVRSVVITGGDAPPSPGAQPCSTDWLHTPQASGWLCAPWIDTPHNHGTGCTFASAIAAAWALGHVDADAVVLARMLTHQALRNGHAAGQGAGPVMAQSGIGQGPATGGAPLPWLGLGESLPWRLALDGAQPVFAPFVPPGDGLYGILADSTQLSAALAAGLRCVQLRHKAREGLDAHLMTALAACAEAGAQLFVNDHWREALAQPPLMAAREGFRLGLHLGQEDLLALTPPELDALLNERDRVMLGLSSHSLWELARAAGCGASYIACGPVQATTTKDMPWRPQGAHNLHWWVSRSPAPVVAIGGLLSVDDVRRAAMQGPAAVCIVRGLGPDEATMRERVPAFAQAVAQGRASLGSPADTDIRWGLPHPVLS